MRCFTISHKNPKTPPVEIKFQSSSNKSNTEISFHRKIVLFYYKLMKCHHPNINKCKVVSVCPLRQTSQISSSIRSQWLAGKKYIFIKDSRFHLHSCKLMKIRYIWTLLLIRKRQIPLFNTFIWKQWWSCLCHKNYHIFWCVFSHHWSLIKMWLFSQVRSARFQSCLCANKLLSSSGKFGINPSSKQNIRNMSSFNIFWSLIRFRFSFFFFKVEPFSHHGWYKTCTQKAISVHSFVL